MTFDLTKGIMSGGGNPVSIIDLIFAAVVFCAVYAYSNSGQAKP